MIRTEGRLSRLRSARKACGLPFSGAPRGSTGRIAAITRDARGSDEPEEGADPWGRKREARSHRGPDGRCTSSIFRGRNQPREPGLGPEAGLYPGEPETCRRSLRLFVRNFIYLALLLAVFKVYRIEERAFQGRAFQMLVTLALAALPVHYLAPFRWKKPVFVAVSVAGLFWIFGIQVAAVVLASSAILLGICFLPIPWIARAAAVAAMAVALGLRAAGLPRTIIPDNVLPILASMFMFRMIIYLYELKHAKIAGNPGRHAQLLFLAAELLLHAFPGGRLPDHAARLFRRRRPRLAAARPADDVAGDGPSLALSPGLPRDVDSRRRRCTTWPVSLATWSATTCLYLQVSGQFHIACGMLHLYGFQLPETHHNYLLATGFTDYWRRINIYWKDFMVRLFFNPVVFRLKRWPQPAALAAGTIGGIPGDLALACLPVVLAARELGFLGSGCPLLGDPGGAGAGECPARRPPEPNGGCVARGRGAHRPTFRELAVRSVKVAATFTTIAVLWSLWSSPSLSAWLEMIGRGFHGS